MNPYTEALYNAILPDLHAGRGEPAITVLKFCLQSEATEPIFHYAIGNAQFRAGDHEAARVALVTATRMQPARAEAFNDLGAALFVLGREAEALACVRRALTLNPTLAEAEETDGIWLLRYGRFREGWRHYEARLRTEANKGLARDYPQPIWQGEPLAGRTILLHSEQGYGDVLQFARYAPLVAARGGRVVLEAYRELLPVLRAVPGVTALIPSGAPLPPFDTYRSLMSLPLLFDTNLDSIPDTVPYLTVPPEAATAWHDRLGPRTGPRVGIAFSGNPVHRDDARRSMKLETLATLIAARPDITFHVLQNAVRESDQPALARHPNVVTHFDALKDFGDTAALIAEMDTTVSVDTSVAHLAAGLGRPVLLMLAHLADWRWLLERADSPWYPTIRLIRQPTRGDWASVLADVALHLEAL